MQKKDINEFLSIFYLFILKKSRTFAHVIELERHIEILLLSNDCVIVPDFGGFMAHHVDAHYDKQEGVPYNISLGGGTQGLADVVYENYKELPEYVLFLEKEFGGSFTGYLKSFKFYSCNQDFTKILANSRFEKSLILKK